MDAVERLGSGEDLAAFTGFVIGNYTSCGDGSVSVAGHDVETFAEGVEKLGRGAVECDTILSSNDLLHRH